MTRSCEAHGAALHRESWSRAQQEQLREHLRSASIRDPTIINQKILPWFDAHAKAWADARTDVCMKTRVWNVWDHDMRDRALWCLDDRRLAFDALVTELSDADDTNIRKAVSAAAKLRRMEPCDDESVLRHLPLMPRDHAGAVTLRRQLARAQALSWAGKTREALTVARETLDRATAFGWAPLVALAGADTGALLDRTGDYEAAEIILKDAYFGSMRVDMLDLAADVALDLAHTVGQSRGRYEEGVEWTRHANAALEVLGAPENGLRRARYRTQRATLHNALGEYAKARTLHQEALANWEAALGPSDPQIAASLFDLGTVHMMTRAYDLARETTQRSLAMWERLLGPSAPQAAYPLARLAELELLEGNPARAVDLATRALTLHEASGASPDVTAAAKFLVARALWDSPSTGKESRRDRPRAHRLAREAREDFAAARMVDGQRSDAIAAHLAEIDAWLTTHGTN